MYQIDNSTAAATQPASTSPGTPGFFTDGNPAGGVQATIVPAEWLNAIQQELINAITAVGLTPTKNAFNQLATAMKGRLINVQTFTTPGTATYTPTPGTNFVVVEVQGAGGGSGGVAATTSGQVAASGAGGSGAYAKGKITSGFSGALVTVGAAGAAGASGTNNGGNGGTSSFGALISAPGGIAGGSLAPGTTIPISRGGSTNSSAPAGGNIVQYPGAPGGGSIMISAATGSIAIGGSSAFGSGGQGSGGNGTSPSAGAGFGSGAGGMTQIQSTVAAAGAIGAPGIVIVSEYA